jgi:hypothetical protein
MPYFYCLSFVLIYFVLSLAVSIEKVPLLSSAAGLGNFPFRFSSND